MKIQIIDMCVNVNNLAAAKALFLDLDSKSSENGQ